MSSCRNQRPNVLIFSADKSSRVRIFARIVIRSRQSGALSAISFQFRHEFLIRIGSNYPGDVV